jgi:hypothetical protein
LAAIRPERFGTYSGRIREKADLEKEKTIIDLRKILQAEFEKNN